MSACAGRVSSVPRLSGQTLGSILHSGVCMVLSEWALAIEDHLLDARRI